MKALYDLALALGTQVTAERIFQASALIAIGVFLIALALVWHYIRNHIAAVGIAIVCCAIVFVFAQGDKDAKSSAIGHDLANIAINAGVSQAQDSQATELQYIHAVIKGYGIDVQKCERRVNSHDFCSGNTPYYTHREINSHQVCSTTTDSKGRSTTTCHEEHDDEYTPWFTEVDKNWIVPDTKFKYLHAKVYDMVPTNSDPTKAADSNPKVYLTKDWRAPENAMQHLYRGERPGQYNDHVPEIWTRVRDAAQAGGAVVTASFVGPYFNWGDAAGSTQFSVYPGQYVTLKALTSLPGPTGISISYTDAYSKPATMKTLLTGKDSDLRVDFPTVFPIGVNINPALLAQLNAKGLEFQGQAGPAKQASLRWFLVPQGIANRLGGAVNVTSALKAYMNDDSVWGLFALPKNLVIMVTIVSDDGTQIVGRDAASGMPFGNVLFYQDMRMSIPAGQSVPLTVENLFGKFTDKYDSQDASKYSFSDMTQAGSAIGIMYQKTEGYTPPNADDPNCETGDPNHHGYIRYRMCTQTYLKTSIMINADGKDLIMTNVQKGAEDRTSVLGAWIMFVLGAAVAVGIVILENQDSN